MSDRVRGVFFDLDGTFADTAPDLAAALNRLCAETGHPQVPLARLRPHTSSGVRGMLGAGIGIFPADSRYAPLHRRFLELYAQDICRHTTLFDGIDELIGSIDDAGLRWGIVTNKQQRFTLPLMSALGWAWRPGCIVSGDSARRAKPYPDSLLLATALVGLPPHECLYVGDDQRDIIAGKAAGMRTVAVRYGYLGEGLPIEAWEADFLVESAAEIGAILT